MYHQTTSSSSSSLGISIHEWEETPNYGRMLLTKKESENSNEKGFLKNQHPISTPKLFQGHLGAPWSKHWHHLDYAIIKQWDKKKRPHETIG